MAPKVRPRLERCDAHDPSAPRTPAAEACNAPAARASRSAATSSGCFRPTSSTSACRIEAVIDDRTSRDQGAEGDDAHQPVVTGGPGERRARHGHDLDVRASRLGLDQRRVERRAGRPATSSGSNFASDGGLRAIDDVGAVDDRRADRAVGDDDRARRGAAAHLGAVGRASTRTRGLRATAAWARTLAGEQEALAAEAAEDRRVLHQPPAAVRSGPCRGARAIDDDAERIGLRRRRRRGAPSTRRRSCPSRPGRSRGPRRSRSPPPASWISNARLSIAFVLPIDGRVGDRAAGRVGDARQQREHLGDRDRVAGRRGIAAARARGRRLAEQRRRGHLAAGHAVDAVVDEDRR